MSSVGEVGVVDDSVAATVSAQDKEFDEILAEPLPVPKPPVVEGEELPLVEQIKEYRMKLYNYYIQYYARFYMSQLRTIYRQYNPKTMYPTALSTLPEASAPADELDLSPVTNNDQLDAIYKQLHFAFNFQASQVYQKWFSDQQNWIIQTATQPKDSAPAEPASYTSKAYFNARTQRFQAQTSEEHWASQGLALDREGRQMAAFFDVEAYQESQRNYKKKKQPKQSAKYWKKKKEERKRRKLLEFVKDDDY